MMDIATVTIIMGAPHSPEIFYAHNTINGDHSLSGWEPKERATDHAITTYPKSECGL